MHKFLFPRRRAVLFEGGFAWYTVSNEVVWMAVRASGLAGKGRRTSVPALLPEVDIRPALVVLPTGAAHAVFLCVLH